MRNFDYLTPAQLRQLLATDDTLSEDEKRDIARRLSKASEGAPHTTEAMKKIDPDYTPSE